MSFATQMMPQSRLRAYLHLSALPPYAMPGLEIALASPVHLYHTSSDIWSIGLSVLLSFRLTGRVEDDDVIEHLIAGRGVWIQDWGTLSYEKSHGTVAVIGVHVSAQANFLFNVQMRIVFIGEEPAAWQQQSRPSNVQLFSLSITIIQI